MKALARPTGKRPRQGGACDALSGEMVRRAAWPPETEAMMIRSGGFYHDGDPPGRQPFDTVALAILLVIVSAGGIAIVLIVRALLFTAGR